jgi:preprotein translocase subunit SecF
VDFFRRQNWDLVGKSWLWFTISGATIVVGIIVLATMGLNMGIDFTGGGLVRYQFARPLAVTHSQQVQVVGQVRSALAAAKLDKVQVMLSGNDEILLRTPPFDTDDTEASSQEQVLRGELEKLFGQEYGPLTSLGRESVGPVIGAELRASAIKALLLGAFLILIYITIRYEFKFAVSSVIALLHDILILSGFMAILRLELDSSFVAVLLTVVGYSINDTVVIFDRIRENMKLHRRADFGATVNASLLQTMARSINTVLTTLIPLTCLAVLGGSTIRAFAIAMIIGIISGAYSSIFNASQIVVVWQRAINRRKQLGSATAGSRRREVRREAAVAVGTVEEDLEDDELEGEDDAATPTRKMSAQEAMARAEELAREEKRVERRERRKQAKDKGGRGTKGKRRF